MTKDDRKRIGDGAPPRQAAPSPEHIAALLKGGPSREQIEALQDPTRAPLEQLRRMNKLRERQSKLREQEGELHARIAHAQRQIEAWRQEKEKAEADLAGFIAAGGIGGKTANPPLETTQTAPADPPRANPPTKETPRGATVLALRELYPEGAAGRALKTVIADVNGWLAAEARAGRRLPLIVKRDTVSRALGRRKT